MSSERFAHVLYYLRTRLGPVSTESTTDAQLLMRFAQDGEVAAFELLMRRHGPLVWRVCRRLLASEHDAEDAFQATFLVLVRKASSIRKQASVASWLYGVAHRIALRARAHAQQRCGPELPNVASSADVVSEVSQREVEAIVEEELAQLPERLRAPLLLCWLEGRSKTEAARQLGWREGTLASRLARARERLRVRLTRRGVALSVGAVASVLERHDEAVPIKTAVAAVRTVSLYTLGEAAAAPAATAPVIALAKGALQATFLMKLKVGAALALVCAILATGVGFAVQRALEQKESAAVPAEGPKRAASDGDPQRAEAQRLRTDSYGDPLPPRALARLGTTRFRHEGEASSVVFSPDGKVLAARCDDGVIMLWDASTGKELQRLRGMASGISLDRLIDFSPDGAILAAPSDDKHVGFWEAATGKLQRTVALPEVTQRPDRAGDIATVRFSPDGKLLAIGGCNNSYVLDVATGQVLHHFKENIGGLVFSPDGRSLVMQVGGNELQVRSIQSGHILRRQEVPAGPGHIPGRGEELTCAIAFSSDGKTMASSGTDRILLWDAATGKLRSRIEAKMGQVKNLAFALDGTALVSGSESDGKVHVWDAATGEERRKLDSRMGILRSMALSPDGKTVAAGTVHSTIRLWELATGKELFPEYEGHDAQVNSVAYSPDGQLLASAGENGQVWVWDTGTGKPVRALRGASARQVAFSPDGQSLAFLSPGKFYAGKVINIYNPSTGKKLLQLRPGDAYEVRTMAFSPDGKTLVSVDWKQPERRPGVVIGSLNVWELQTGKRLRQFPMEGLRPECLAVSPNGRTVVVAGCSDGQSIRIWDLLRGEETLSFRGGQLVKSIALSADGRTLISGGVDQTVGCLRLWELSTGREIYAFNAQVRDVTAVAFSPDGRTIASSDIGNKHADTAQESPGIRLWDVATGQEIRHLERCASTVTTLAFSPDGSRLASGLQNSTVLLWEVLPAPSMPRQRGAQWSRNELEALWSDLAGEDAHKAYQAIYTLAAAPAQTIPFLAAQLRPTAEVDPERVQRLIADLDSNRFARRAAAGKELAELGDRVELALRHVLEGKPTLEMRQRVETLLARAQMTPPPTTLRVLRAIQVLERIGTPEAQQVLRKFAAGASGARETRDARDALERLARQPVRKP